MNTDYLAFDLGAESGRAMPGRLRSGVLGVDYALIDERGELVEDPYHYRDSRTNGVMEAVFAKVPRETIYAITGIQFLPFNTLYQLYAVCRLTPAAIHSAKALATIPDFADVPIAAK